ncbi:putative sodium/alanine symporter family protein [gamma proteobacterium HTCC2207]|uniref:Putative sodium/alanine symporter family protein n=1 Tax=gamma proteobacterium HTCC2207 TaxID=314287 RepID=Q1YQG3_9GAMM|nr:putative sodium/alanine symporter family protein [gamma proteobacterium HTCC2207]MBT5106290.1 alanine:cation symporter family protein [Porticoccaceae bacterium]MBT6593402.1 alanine:cation symporter family protein [Porticoccaceae bacterium]MDB4426787.1 alanine:cation symporter family protein [Porticoccaceae bacterium]MDB4581192.1 alanine:cation symporter family protein [Porticoccaceae bacterium]
MEAFVNYLNGIIWSSALIYLCLGTGLYFSLRTRFLQVRHFGHMLKIMREGKSSEAGVSSFQALTMSLSGRVGTGNIAGVATAIAIGGPGAVFWMWTVAFLGASTAYIEATLAQIYKELDDNGSYRGGPAYYIEKAMGQKWYAWTFAVATIIAMGFCLPGIQANSIVAAMNNAWEIPALGTASVLAIGLALIVIGGVKRIAHFAQVVVPLMAAGYILIAFTVVFLNIDMVPTVTKLIINSAFGLDAGYGAIIGMAVAWGVKRGVYSNEAGQGSGPHPAAAAEVSHPAKQGLVQAFSVYVDTLLICSATAFMILLTGLYNVEGADGTFLYQGLPGVDVGPAYVQAAFDTVLPGFGSSVLAIALLFFAFTTIVAYYYIAETNVMFINRKVHRPWLANLLKVLVLTSVMYGGLKSADLAWALGDVGVGLMAWLNIVAILILQRPALVALKDYEQQLDAGVDPQFDPQNLGIEKADFWVDRKNAQSQ